MTVQVWKESYGKWGFLFLTHWFWLQVRKALNKVLNPYFIHSEMHKLMLKLKSALFGAKCLILFPLNSVKWFLPTSVGVFGWGPWMLHKNIRRMASTHLYVSSRIIAWWYLLMENELDDTVTGCWYLYGIDSEKIQRCHSFGQWYQAWNVS